MIYFSTIFMQDLPFPVTAFRAEFPFLKENPDAAYLDSAATTLRPQALIDATVNFYASAGSVHRSQHDEANTTAYENTRKAVAKFVGAEKEECVIWTSGSTHAANLVARGIAPSLNKGDEIILTFAEHHANFVPWQQLALEKGLKYHVIPFNHEGILDINALKNALNSHTKFIALNWVSNISGAEQPLNELIPLIRKRSSAQIFIDAAQAVSLFPIDIQKLDCDFLAFSAHKLYGPTGLGVLTGKFNALDRVRPLFYGGKMVNTVTANETTFAPLPYRLEAGTPNIAGVIGFGAVLTWWQKWNTLEAKAHTIALAEETRIRLANYPTCQIFSAPNSSVVSFVFTDIASSDLALVLGEHNIAFRSGKHCAEPYLTQLGQSNVLRLSFAPYNQQSDIDRFFTALDEARDLLC